MILKELKEMKHDAKLLDGTPSQIATWQSPIILSCFHTFYLGWSQHILLRVEIASAQNKKRYFNE